MRLDLGNHLITLDSRFNVHQAIKLHCQSQLDLSGLATFLKHSGDLYVRSRALMDLWDGCMWLYSPVVLNKDLCCKFPLILRPGWPITWPIHPYVFFDISKQPLALLWVPASHSFWGSPDIGLKTKLLATCTVDVLEGVCVKCVKIWYT